MSSSSLTMRREVRPDDVATVREIVRASGYFNHSEVDVAVELVQECLSKGEEASGYYFIFAEDAGRVVGYSCFGPVPGTVSSFDLYWIAVRDDWRRKGLGRRLMDDTEAVITAMGGKRIYIETSSRDQYRPTRQFYEKCGYRAEAVIQDFYAPDDSKVIYVKVPAPPAP